MILNLAKKILYKLGYKVNKINKTLILNENYLQAIKDKIGSKPILFDVGANNGQTVTKFKAQFPDATIYSFEPSKYCFDILKQKHANTNGVTLVNKGVGRSRDTLEFNETSWSNLNSFLKRSFTTSKIIENYPVDVIPIDNYCMEQDIRHINLLKTDTEGFEQNVLEGAEKMMDANRIQFVYTEVFFYENYIGQSSFGDMYNYLIKKGFSLIRFYRFEYTATGFASRTDALFYNPKYSAG